MKRVTGALLMSIVGWRLARAAGEAAEMGEPPLDWLPSNDAPEPPRRKSPPPHQRKSEEHITPQAIPLKASAERRRSRGLSSTS